MSDHEILIAAASGPADLEEARTLFREYARSLHFDLDFQGFDAEMDSFPGDYVPPKGTILIARVDGAAAGAVGLRPLDAGICEMKRMYVRPNFRGLGLGRKLANAVVEAGRAAGYAAMRLDTVAALAEANALYASIGFTEIPPYCFNPLPDARFLEKRPL
jgi:putative acetyltransferase